MNKQKLEINEIDYHVLFYIKLDVCVEQDVLRFLRKLFTVVLRQTFDGK